MKNNVYLPTTKSKKNSIILIILLLIIYLFENLSIITKITGPLLYYMLKVFLWSGLAFIVWKLPAVKTNGKLRLRQSIYSWSFIFAIIYLVALFIGGLINGIGKSPYFGSPINLLLNAITIVPMLIGREFVRGYLINSLVKKESTLVSVLVAILMTLIGVPFNKYSTLTGSESIVKYIGQTLAPDLFNNFLANYLAFLGGKTASIIYMGILLAFNWFSPILPDLQWITSAFIGILFPIFSLSAMQQIYAKESHTYSKIYTKNQGLFGWIVTSVLSITLIWFSAGVFPVSPSVIATGSMLPFIKPGDVVLIKKVGKNAINVGDIIQFKREDILISHRIIDIVEDDLGIGYKTKGDNNSGADTELVRPEKIKGEIIYTIPKIGWPTLLLKKKDDMPLKQVQF
jgi:signal peptidase